jgi:hypothetical protein
MNPNPLDDNFSNAEKPDKKKGKGGLIALIIILLLVVAAVLVIALDVGGIRENHIMRYLRNAPLIGSLFSEPEVDPVEEMTEEEMRLMIHNLQNQVSSLENQRNELNTQLVSANTRISHLVQFERQWNDYREATALFTQMLAHNEPVEFVSFFETIVNRDLVPEDILAIVYAQARAINAYNEELQVLVSTYNNMEE